jgi:hypothetical protein
MKMSHALHDWLLIAGFFAVAYWLYARKLK